MPVTKYQCTCGTIFETMSSVNGDNVSCSNCGSTKVEKVQASSNKKKPRQSDTTEEREEK